MRISAKEAAKLSPKLAAQVKASGAIDGKKEKSDFDSKAEQHYYERVVVPLLLAKEVTSCELHKEFEVIPALDFGGQHYRHRVFKPDFLLTFPDGHVKVVEVKGEYARRAQRDYPLRRQLFIIHHCIPNGWEFEEVPAAKYQR